MAVKRKAKPTRKKRVPELKVVSREDVEHYEPTLREVCISISDPGAQPAGLSPRFAAVLRMSFDDVIERGDPADIIFAEEQARAIHRFIDEWSDADRIILHCNMGVSRSPGVALGLCDAQGWATAELERSHPGWNRLVRSVMAQAASSPKQQRAR